MIAGTGPSSPMMSLPQARRFDWSNLGLRIASGFVLVPTALYATLGQHQHWVPALQGRQEPFVDEQLAQRPPGDMGRFHTCSIGAHLPRVETGFSPQASAAAPSYTSMNRL